MYSSNSKVNGIERRQSEKHMPHTLFKLTAPLKMANSGNENCIFVAGAGGVVPARPCLRVTFSDGFSERKMENTDGPAASLE